MKILRDTLLFAAIATNGLLKNEAFHGTASPNKAKVTDDRVSANGICIEILNTVQMGQTSTWRLWSGQKK